MTTLKEIEAFLEPKKLAIAGVGRKKNNFGRSVMTELSKKGFDIAPINPNTDDLDGTKSYKSVLELPDGYDHLLIVTNKKNTQGVVEDAVKKGIKYIWMQQSTDTPEAVQIASDNNIPLIYKKCILMHSDPKGIHKFHKGLVKLFGKFPK